MNRIGSWTACCALWVLCISTNLSAEDLTATAAELYAEQNWSEAITAYQQVLNQSDDLPAPTIEQAWYRIANAHIQLNQGQAALKANAHLSAATRIPAPQVLYQQAQAHNLVGDEVNMWKTLSKMAASGFSNSNELSTNPMWHKYTQQEQFKSVTKQVDKNLKPCLHDPRYRQFDFWLGRWEVYGNVEKTGPFYGHNTITRTEQGCLIMEQWQGASGSTGTSMNYYDGTIDQWVQRWVSGGGTVIDYAGGLIERPDNSQAMQLVGKIYYASDLQQPQIRDFRGTWTPLDHGVVQQFFEESTDGGKSWYPWFNGFYFPIKGGDNNEE